MIRENYGLGIGVSVWLAVVGFFGYAKIHDLNQPINTINNACVEDISPYSIRTDFGICHGTKLKISEESRTVRYQDRNLTSEFSKGDLVKITFKEDFFGELDGVEISRNE